MAACEWCWGEAFKREMADTSKSQAEHYEAVRREQDEMGDKARCPMARSVARPAPATEGEDGR